MNYETLDQALSAIEARLATATPGPLEVVRFDNDGGEISYQLETKITGASHCILAWYTDLENPRAKADCTFAAHAPTDIARLLKALRLCVEQRNHAIRLAHRFGNRAEEHSKRDVKIKRADKALAEVLGGDGK